MKTLQLLFLFGSSLLITGCMKLSAENLPGSYQGTWSREGAKDLVPVRAEISEDLEAKNAVIAEVNCSNKKLPCHFQFAIQKRKRTQVSVQVSGDQNFEGTLQWSNGDKIRPCLSEDGSELCFSEDEIRFTFVDAKSIHHTFSLTKSSSASPSRSTLATPPNPQVYLLSALLDRANRLDFSSRIEYQRYLESRYNAKTMLLNQLPHVSMGTVANVLGGLNPGSLLQVAGDLVPFLLPNRWLQVKESSLVSKAEFQSSIIIRLNAILFTETLAHSYLRDSAAIQALTHERLQVLSIYNELKVRESMGQLPNGSALDIQSILLAIDTAKLQLEQTVKLELQATALSVGMTNPRAILKIEDDLKRNIGQKEVLTESEVLAQALQHAHEIQQANYLYQAARVARVEHFFSWLDPSGSSQYSLGAALFPATRSASAQIEEFRLIEAQINAQIQNRAAGLMTNLDFAFKTQSLTDLAIEVQAARVKRILDQLEYGTNFVLADLVGALQDQVSAQLNVIGNEALYRTTEAQIDRLISRGVYHDHDQFVLE